jgi:tetratricopeptide (TPR) repeat protein
MKPGVTVRPARSCILLCLILLPGCGLFSRPAAGPPPDAELAAATSAARVAYERGLVREAAGLYERALTRARAMDDSAQIANAAYNAATCFTSLAQYDRASELLAEAKNETRRSGGRAADVLLMQARVAWLQGRTTDALSIADEVLATVPPAHPSERVQAHCLKGRIACDAGDQGTASAELAQARKDAADTTDTTDAADPIAQARLAELTGRVELLQGRSAQAASEFDHEASLLREGHLYADMTQALGRAAAAHKDASQPQLAADRFYRAARSAYAQGDRPEALRLIKAASETAEAAADASLLRMIRSLSREIELPLEK